MAAAKKEKSKAEFTTQKFKDYTISKKRSGRFEVTAKNGKNVNGVDKAKILVDAKLVQASFAKKASEESAEA